jgi:hypothetical protein
MPGANPQNQSKIKLKNEPFILCPGDHCGKISEELVKLNFNNSEGEKNLGLQGGNLQQIQRQHIPIPL